MLKIYFIGIALLILSISAKSQSVEELKQINQLVDSASNMENLAEKQQVQERIHSAMMQILRPATSFNNKMDSLKRIGFVNANDDKFRIFTWTFRKREGTYDYNGIIQMNPGKDSVCKLYALNDISYNIPEQSNTLTINVPDWFGTLYYQVIKVKSNDTKVYTLIGTRFNDLFTNQKILESLYFNENDVPVFGYPIFEYGLKLSKRVVFEYSINAVMSMKYNDDMEMIIFDHLAPSSPMYTGNFKFYGPDFSFDAYKFENDTWKYIPNINVKNTNERKPPKPIKRIIATPRK